MKIDINNKINPALRLMMTNSDYSSELVGILLMGMPDDLLEDLKQEKYHDYIYNGELGIFRKYYDEENDVLVIQKYPNMNYREIILKVREFKESDLEYGKEKMISSLEVFEKNNSQFDKYHYYVGKVKEYGQDSHYVYAKYNSKFSEQSITKGYTSKEYFTPNQVWDKKSNSKEFMR